MCLGEKRNLVIPEARIRYKKIIKLRFIQIVNNNKMFLKQIINLSNLKNI